MTAEQVCESITTNLPDLAAEIQDLAVYDQIESNREVTTQAKRLISTLRNWVYENSDEESENEAVAFTNLVMFIIALNTKATIVSSILEECQAEIKTLRAQNLALQKENNTLREEAGKSMVDYAAISPTPQITIKPKKKPFTALEIVGIQTLTLKHINNQNVPIPDSQQRKKKVSESKIGLPKGSCNIYVRKT